MNQSKLTKEEMSKKLNILFGTDIKFERLSKQDLEELYSFFNDPKTYLKRLKEVMGQEEFSNFMIEYIKEECITYIVKSDLLRKKIKEIVFKKIII